MLAVDVLDAEQPETRGISSEGPERGPTGLGHRRLEWSGAAARCKSQCAGIGCSSRPEVIHSEEPAAVARDRLGRSEVSLTVARPFLDVVTGILGERWSEGPGSLYEKLARSLRRAVDHGLIPTGTRLPAERQLADGLFVSRSTVVAAYGILRREGLVTSRQGSGTWVRGRRSGTFGDEEALGLLARDAYLSGFIDANPVPIDLTVPNPTAALETLFDDALLLRAGRDLASEATPLGYQPRGLPSLRRELARQLEVRGLLTAEDDILITTGAQQAISLLLSLFVRPHDEVIVENPSYRGLIDSLVFVRAKAIPWQFSERRMPARLEQLLAKHVPRLVFLTPTCHNPTGLSLDTEARREIALAASKSGVPIVEDAVLADLSLEEPPPFLASFETSSAPVILVGSLSKSFWGGLRVGWLRAPSPIISRLVRLKALADMGTSTVSQVVARELMAANPEKTLEIQREEVRATLAVMEESLRTHLPSWRWPDPAGGRSVWVQLPAGNGNDFAQVALLHGVAVSSGSTVSLDGTFDDHLRIAFVQSPTVIREGCRRLADAWSSYAARLAA
jgi:DNA-binding transcriptional MocR family regulator